MNLGHVLSNLRDGRPAEAMYSISKGDQYECALAVLQHLRDMGPGPGESSRPPVVYDEGEFWRYDGKVWRRIKLNDMQREVLRMSSWATWDDGSSIKMTRALVSGVVELAEIEAAHEGFFASAAPGLAFRNGFVTVRKGKGVKISEHHHDSRARHCYDFDYDPDAKSPYWDRFLDSLFECDDDAEDKKRSLAQYVGACLTGIVTNYNRALMLTGSGANGKSVLCDIIEMLFPAESVTCLAPQDMDRAERVSSLVGAKLNLVTDIPIRDMRDTGGFKQIVAGDHVAARRLYENPFRFKPMAGHIFSCNRLPIAMDSTNGFFRRWIVVSFNMEFGQGGKSAIPRDELVARLEAEKSGIMRWALNGALDLMEKGLFLPPSSSELLEDWRETGDQSLAFLSERCVVLGTSARSSEGTTPSEFYAHYTKWANDSGHKRLSKREFLTRMTSIHKLPKRRIGAGVIYLVRVLPENMMEMEKRKMSLEEYLEADDGDDGE